MECTLKMSSLDYRSVNEGFFKLLVILFIFFECITKNRISAKSVPVTRKMGQGRFETSKIIEFEN